MRIVFFGTPDFAVPTAQALLEAGHELVLVVAQPDAPAGRGQQLTAPPVARWAQDRGLPLAQPRALKSGRFPERLASLAPDLGVVVAYGRILPEPLLKLPRWGCLNVHASLLPRWRGAAPIQRALAAGDLETGVAVQQMEATLDTGPLHEVVRTPILPTDTSGSLHARLAALGAQATLRAIAGLGGRAPVPQAEEGVTYAAKVEKEEGQVQLSAPAEAIERQLRAFDPGPGAFLALPSGPLKLRQVTVVEGQGEPGEVLSLRPLVVATGRGALRLDRVQAAGRKEVEGHQFANGARLVVGSRLA